jgi:hypothetical protein
MRRAETAALTRASNSARPSATEAVVIVVGVGITAVGKDLGQRAVAVGELGPLDAGEAPVGTIAGLERHEVGVVGS